MGFNSGFKGLSNYGFIVPRLTELYIFCTTMYYVLHTNPYVIHSETYYYYYSKVAKAVTFQSCIWEVTNLILRQDTKR